MVSSIQYSDCTHAVCSMYIVSGLTKTGMEFQSSHLASLTGYVQVSTYVLMDCPQRRSRRRLTTGKHPLRSFTTHY